MRRFVLFLQNNAVYVALAVGLAAFATLIVMYDYKDAGNSLSREQAIDLGKAELDSSEDASGEDKLAGVSGEAVKKDKTANKDKTDNKEQIAGSTDAQETDAEDNKAAPVVGGTYSDTPTVKLDFNEDCELVWPVEGEVIMPFSMDTTVYYKTLKSYKCNPGMMIKADENTSVRSAYEGVVESIENTSEYGTVVTVDIGNGYRLIYGQLMNVSVAEGDEISKAGKVGEIAPVSNYYKQEGAHLYFAMTMNNEPVNPEKYIR